MDEDEKQSILSLYPEFSQVTGPYIRKSDNRAVVALTGFKKTTTRQLAKVRLEVKLGRRLVGDETVDHRDEDKTNDAPSNLDLLSKSDNSRKSSVGNQYSIGRKAPEEEKLYGEDNSKALLSNKEVELYRQKFSAGEMSKSEIMMETRMSDKAVRNFLYGDSYKTAGYVVERRRSGRPSSK